MYEGDSFFTLSAIGQVGLVAVSLVLMLASAALTFGLGRGRARVVGIGLGIVVFWLFLWLSPQVYYLYYMTLIDGLPWQSVIKSPPGFKDMLSLLTFTDAPNLSSHSKGLLGWGLIGLGVWSRRSLN